MKFKGIRRFFDSFRNLIDSLRRRQPQQEEDVPKTPDSPKAVSPTIETKDLEAVKSEPPLPSGAALDKIKIKPRKNHPIRVQDKPCDPCKVDDLSDTASNVSSDILGPGGDFKSEKDEVDTPKKVPLSEKDEAETPKKVPLNENNEAETPKKVPLKPPPLIKPSISIKDVEKTGSSKRLLSPSEGNIQDGIDDKPPLTNACSNASLASSVSAKSSEVFEKQRHPSSETTDAKCCSTSSETRGVLEEIPSLSDSGHSIPNSDNQSDDVAFQKQDSKASLEEGAGSISSSNDAELFSKEKTASPLTLDASLNGPSPTSKSPIPAPRNIKPKDVSLSSSESLKLSSVTDKAGSTWSSKNLKGSKTSLDSRETISRTHSSPHQLKTSASLNSQEENTKDLKLIEVNENVDSEADNTMRDEVFQKETPNITPSECSLNHENQGTTHLGAGKSSSMFENVPSLFPTEEIIDMIDENHVNQEKSDGCLEDGDAKPPRPGDDLEKAPPIEIQVTPRSTSDKNVEPGNQVEKPPALPPKPEKPQLKLPPAVPTKPKFNKN